MRCTGGTEQDIQQLRSGTVISTPLEIKARHKDGGSAFILADSIPSSIWDEE